MASVKERLALFEKAKAGGNAPSSSARSLATPAVTQPTVPPTTAPAPVPAPVAATAAPAAPAGVSLADLVLGKKPTAAAQALVKAPAEPPKPSLPRAGSFQDLVLGASSSPSAPAATLAPQASSATPAPSLPRQGSFQDLVLGKKPATAAAPSVNSATSPYVSASSIEEKPAPLQKSGSFQDLVLKKQAVASSTPVLTEQPQPQPQPVEQPPKVTVDRRPSVGTKIAMLREKKKMETGASAATSADEFSAKRLASIRAELGVEASSESIPMSEDVKKILDEASALVHRTAKKPEPVSMPVTASPSSTVEDAAKEIPANGTAAPSEAASSAAAPASTATTTIRFEEQPAQEYRYDEPTEEPVEEVAWENASGKDEHGGATNGATESKSAVVEAPRRKSIGGHLLGVLKRSFSLRDAAKN